MRTYSANVFITITGIEANNTTEAEDIVAEEFFSLLPQSKLRERIQIDSIESTEEEE